MGLTKVSTDGVKDDAITKTKIPANQIEASELADNAVDTNAIANNAVTAGKLASGVQTTINNNADNRLITGSGSANTLNAESNVVIDANGKLGIGTTSPGYDVTVYKSSGTSRGRFHTAGTSGNDYADLAVQAGSNYAQLFVYGTGQVYMTASAPATMSVGNVADSSLYLTTNNTIRQTITNGGNVGIGTTSPAKKLDVNGEIRASSGILFGSDTAAANALNDYEEGGWTATCVSGGSSFVNDSNNNKYVKIGSMVFITGEVYGLNNPNNNTFEVGGLPYQIAQSREGTGSIMCNNINFVGRTMCTLYVYASQTKFRIYMSGNQASWRASTGTDFTSNGDIIFSFAYQTTA